MFGHDIVDISIVPIGFVDKATQQPVCLDGRTECQIYAATLCGMMMGISPGHPAMEDGEWPHDVASPLDMPLDLFGDLVAMGAGGNAYNSYYFKACQDAGFDDGYITSCARSPATIDKLTAGFQRAIELGKSPAPSGDTRASLFVDGKEVTGWHAKGTLCGAVCSAYTGTPPADVCGECNKLWALSTAKMANGEQGVACYHKGSHKGSPSKGSKPATAATAATATDAPPDMLMLSRSLTAEHSQLLTQLANVSAAAAAAAASTAAPMVGNGHDSTSSTAAEVEIILYCTGDMLTLHEYCAKFIAYAEQRVLMLLGSKPSSGASWVNLTVVPSGNIVQLPGSVC